MRKVFLPANINRKSKPLMENSPLEYLLFSVNAIFFGTVLPGIYLRAKFLSERERIKIGSRQKIPMDL